MGLGRLLLCVTVLCLLTEANAKLQYALSTPAQLNSGKSGRICVNLVECSEPLDLVVVLQHEGKNYSIIAENVKGPVYFQCKEFRIPKVSSSVPVVIIFSATGKNTDLRERKTVVIKPTSNFCKVQMDKPIYKPGQKVLFRLICLTPELKPVDEKYTSVSMQDPSRTKVAQWLQPKCNHGVVSLEFSLISDAVPGSYIITAERESGSPVTEWFRVEEYVLPRFDLTVNAPDSLSVTAENLRVNVSAMYTFGEPLAGSVIVRYCKQPEFYGRRQNCFKDKGRFCSNMTDVLGPGGSYSGVIDLFHPSMRSAGRGTSISIDVTVVETGTGIQSTESRYVYITSQPANLQLDYDNINQHYKRGLNYSLVATLKDESSQPMPNEKLQLDIDGSRSQSSITGPDGQAVFEIDTSDMVAPNFTLKVSYQNPDQCYYSEWSQTDYPSVDYTVYRFYSESGSFLQMKRPNGELTCDKKQNITVDFVIGPAGVGKGASKVTFYYMILSSSNIVQSGQKVVALSSSMRGRFSFEVKVSADLSPSADMVVYTILQKELIADTVKLNIEKCFKNDVSMTFEKEKGTPGSEVVVHLSADPNSICGLRVLDSSLMLLNSYESFSADSIFNSLRTWFYGYNIDGFDVEDPEPPCEDPDKVVFFDGRYYVPVSSPSEGDTYTKLKGIGLIVGTGASVRKPVVCDNNPPSLQIPRPGILAKVESDVRVGSVSNLAFNAGAGSAAPVETVRTNFAETFMWLMSPVNSEGRGTVKEKAPDTITKWQGTAFCLSNEHGFGMTRHPANYITFQPFFGELNLPYSSIRGETLVLVGVARNYMEECVKVQVILENSADYNAVLKDGLPDTCICKNERAAYTWEVDVKKIGQIKFTMTAKTTSISQNCGGPNDPSKAPRKDTLVQSMLVEPEGVRREKTLSDFILAKSEIYSKSVSIPLPANVVPDSQSAYVTTVGDIFGLSLQNLDNMVQKPYGCGEQTISRMAVIPAVLNYLNNTGQLTKELLEKGKSYLSEGYYRLSAFSRGGCYNLFPRSIDPGNSWLTAFAFKTKEQSKPFIFIDETQQQQTLICLENSQRLDNGCFKASGKTVTSQDSDHDLQFTAYLASVLLETDYGMAKTLLDGAMDCLKNASHTEQKLFDQVLMLYAFSLAEEWDYVNPMLEKLMKKAITEDGTIHWEREQMPKGPSPLFFRPTFASSDVEMTAYMLKSIAAGSSSPGYALADRTTTMAQISVWLGRQVNAYGGLRSTQDTVITLQALANFAQSIYVPDAHQNVVIKKGNGEIGKFGLNKDNRLLVQRKTLPDTSSNYNIEVSGTGWCLIQTTVAYNIPVPKENSAYSLDITTSSDKCINKVAYAFKVNVTLSYRGHKEEAGMTIVQIRLLTGYSPDFSSMYKLVSDKVISKAEKNARGHVVLYLEKVTKKPINFSFMALMGQRVLNVKTSSGYVYSYYDEDENGYASYNHPCSGAKAQNSY